MYPNITVPEGLALALFNAVEVAPVWEKDGMCEQINEDEIGLDPEAEYFWSVYLHYDASLPENKGFGGLECIADLPNEDAAMAYAKGLQEALYEVIGSRLIKNIL